MARKSVSFKPLWLIGLALIVLQPLSIASTKTVHASDWSPAPKPADFSPAWLPICTTDAQLDCLESIGAYVNGTLVKGTPTGRVETNSFNSSVIPEWRIPGIVNEDGKDLVQTQLRTRQLPGGQIGMSIEMYVSSQDGYRPRWESARNDCTFKNPQGQCFRFGNPQSGTKFSATFRSRWILPNIVSGSLDQADAKVERLTQPGSSRVTVAGIPMTYQLRDNAIAGQKDEAGLALLKWFRFDVTDGRFLPRPWQCLDSSPPLIFGNGVGGGSAPTFADGELDFQVSSPHFEPDATTKFMGIYNATIPLATAECMWKTKIAQSDQLQVKIFESQDGTAQSASTSINITSDFVTLRSTGFTYSTKTVRVTSVSPVTSKLPSKPTKVVASGGSRSLKVSFKRVQGLTYTATATLGKTRKSLRCTSSKTLITCTGSRLQSGRWKVSITPKQGSLNGTSASVAVRVK
jgi:hypothetical protein